MMQAPDPTIRRVDTPAARQLAFEAAIQGIVLLQNEAYNGTGLSSVGAAHDKRGAATGAMTGLAAGQPLLPLPGAQLSGKTIAVIGPNANTSNILSIYVGTNTLVHNHTILLGIQDRAAAFNNGINVAYAEGCSVSCSNSTGFAAAVATASSADIVVLVMGIQGGPTDDGSGAIEDEGHDRVNLTLPGLQPDLIAAVMGTGKPIVLVLVHGGPVDIGSLAMEGISSILDVHYPGEMGGDAVAAILFGDYSPSGRETVTWYPADFINQRQMKDMILPPHTDVATGQPAPGITHLYYDGPVLWPFGWGLSYTTFSYTWFNPGAGASTFPSADADAEVVIEVNIQHLLAAYSSSSSSSAAAAASSSTAASPHGRLLQGPGPYFAVNVTNTGTVTSDVSALAFVFNNQSALEAAAAALALPHPRSGGSKGIELGQQPLQELFDFQRAASVAPGSTVTLTFTMPPPDVLAVVTNDGRKILVPGDYQIRVGDVPHPNRPSPADASGWVTATLRLTGEAASLPEWDLPPMY